MIGGELFIAQINRGFTFPSVNPISLDMDALAELEAAIRAAEPYSFNMPEMVLEALYTAATWVRLPIGIALGLAIGA